MSTIKTTEPTFAAAAADDVIVHTTDAQPPGTLAPRKAVLVAMRKGPSGLAYAFSPMQAVRLARMLLQNAEEADKANSATDARVRLAAG